MIRNFFVDFVVVCALSLVVWGATPAWAFWCLCVDQGPSVDKPECKTTEIINDEGQPQTQCSHDGWCGIRTVRRVNFMWGVPYTYCVTTSCACAHFGSGDSPRCQCRPIQLISY